MNVIDIEWIVQIVVKEKEVVETATGKEVIGKVGGNK